MRYYNFITDFTEKEVTGGAELCDADLRTALEAKGWLANIIQPGKTKYWDYELPTIVSNRSLFDYDMLMTLLKDKKYIVIEHDYQILKGRNPYRDVETNPVEFYMNAGKVIFQSTFQQELFTGILSANFLDHMMVKNRVNFGNPFFSPKYLKQLGDRYRTAPYERALILNSTNGIKGTEQAIQVAKQLNIDYTLFPKDPLLTYTYDEFAKELSAHRYFIFMPLYPESYSRILLEAAVNGCELITSANSGFYHQFESLGFDPTKLLPTITENCERMVNEIVCELQQS